MSFIEAERRQIIFDQRCRTALPGNPPERGGDCTDSKCGYRME